jgi:non-ribosomal peptide synthetase component F
VSCGEASLTYLQLNLCAEALASRLRAAGVVPGSLVGLCVGRGVGFAIGVLGILKAGCAWVPLDPTHPKEQAASGLPTREPVA